MQVNIDTKQALRLAGKAFKLTDKSEAGPIRDDFLKTYQYDLLDELEAAYGLLQYNAIDQSYDYFLGFELADETIIADKGFEIREIDPSLYLELPVEGMDGLAEAYHYTYEEFFPNKKYFHGLGPDVEFYQYDSKQKAIGNVELYICLKKNPHNQGDPGDQ